MSMLHGGYVAYAHATVVMGGAHQGVYIGFDHSIAHLPCPTCSEPFSA